MTNLQSFLNLTIFLFLVLECVGFKTTHTVSSFEFRDIILPKSPNINILQVPEVATSSTSLLTEEKKTQYI